MQNLIDEKGNLTDVAEAQRIVNDEISRNVALRMKNEASSKITSEYMGDYVDALDSLREKLTKKVGKESAAYLTKEIKNAVESGLGDDDGVAELLHRFGLTYVEFHNDIMDVNNPFLSLIHSLGMYMGMTETMGFGRLSKEWESEPEVVCGKEVVPYGVNNNLPVEVRDMMDENNLAPGILEREKGLLYGQGLELYVKKYENGEVTREWVDAVSYTHLDVYKRQLVSLLVLWDLIITR